MLRRLRGKDIDLSRVANSFRLQGRFDYVLTYKKRFLQPVFVLACGKDLCRPVRDASSEKKNDSVWNARHSWTEAIGWSSILGEDGSCASFASTKDSLNDADALYWKFSQGTDGLPINIDALRSYLTRAAKLGRFADLRNNKCMIINSGDSINGQSTPVGGCRTNAWNWMLGYRFGRGIP
ncbi:hypothetical protein HN011_000988 [Eciton burchellii]|nr:hypothetical protein HN011_000988 [Eciton burchellii]